ncbi:amidophosphoribosyltransferase [Bacteroidia bacterium]|nr:amidophosphoribosyltransferase [Bacteroidia bacterium]
MIFKTLLSNFLALFFPDLCVVCREPLLEGETFLCLHCALKLPKTAYRSYVNNLSFDRFLGKIPLEKVNSYLYYSKGGIGQKLVADIKYKGNVSLGKWMGECMAKDVLSSGFFDGIDFIVPVPLHPKRLKQRGYNQSEIIAEGISFVTDIPLDTKNLFRKKATATQTKRGIYERWRNTLDIFDLHDRELFAGKHILIIDDVLTTGSTLEAAAHCILESKGSKVSILTLAVA